MRRRHALRTISAVGSAWLSGCGMLDRSTSGDDADTFEVEPSELLPPITVFGEAVDRTWTSEDEIQTGLVKRAQTQAAYRATDQGLVIPDGVEVGVWIFEDVATAKSHYDDMPYHEGWGMTPGDIAVESIQGLTDKGREYRVLFRDANAMGGLAYLNPRSGNDERMRRFGLDLAGAMHEYWRS